MEVNQSMGVRRSEMMAALSLATDLAMGQPVEFALKSCVLATRIGHKLALDANVLAEIYHQSLLRYIGCNAETHTMVALFGDEIGFRRDFARIDTGRAAEMAALVFAYLRRANAGAGMLETVASVARGLVASHRVAVENISGHCEVAERLAERFGFSAEVRRNLGQIYERWDGLGLPRGLKAEAIAPAVRIVSLAQDAIVLDSAYGADTALAKLKARSGGAYEPRLVTLFTDNAQTLTAGLDETSWDAVLALDPQPPAVMSSS